MELILLAVAGIVWAVIKAISQQPPKRPVPRPVSPGRIPTDTSPRPAPRTSPPLISDTYDVQQEMTLEAEELDSGSMGFELTESTLVQGVIMAEVLGPPRAQNPHKLYRMR